MTSIEKALEYIKNAEFEIERLPEMYKFGNGHHARYQECLALAETLRRSVTRLKTELIDAIMIDTSMDEPSPTPPTDTEKQNQ